MDVEDQRIRDAGEAMLQQPAVAATPGASGRAPALSTPSAQERSATWTTEFRLQRRDAPDPQPSDDGGHRDVHVDLLWKRNHCHRRQAQMQAVAMPEQCKMWKFLDGRYVDDGLRKQEQLLKEAAEIILEDDVAASTSSSHARRRQ